MRSRDILEPIATIYRVNPTNTFNGPPDACYDHIGIASLSLSLSRNVRSRTRATLEAPTYLSTREISIAQLR